MYGTQAMADDVNLSLEEYREEIIKACFLDFDDPVAERERVYSFNNKAKKRLDELSIESVHVF
jgi:aminopeptidase